MFKRVTWFTLAITLASATHGMAGLNSWSTEVESDPFSGGTKVTVDFSSSLRSGVILRCDTSQQGMMVRAVPGFAYDDILASIKPVMEFAIDGNRLLEQQGVTGAAGENLAVSQVQLTREDAATLAQAFVKAKRQIAIKDGISDKPFLLRASGSSKAGAALEKCLEKQFVFEPRTGPKEALDEGALLTEAGRFVKFKALAVTAQEVCVDQILRPEALIPTGLDREEVETVEANIMDGELVEAKEKMRGKSCFAAMREPLRFSKLTLEQVWRKK